MSGNFGKPPEAWRNHGIKNPVAACSLQVNDLKRLFRILNKHVFAYRDIVMPQLSQLMDETEEAFKERAQRVFNSFITSVTIKTNAGVQLTANNENAFNEEEMPISVQSIFLSTKSVPASIFPSIPCFASVFLDFSQPPAFDLSRLPTLATPNETQFEIQADNESWFLVVKSDLTEFFRENKTSVNWMHQAGSYDALLFVIGLPFSIWISSLAGRITRIETLPSVIKIACYVYVFFFSLNLFRMFFSYTRWVFPKIELRTERGSPFRHRGVWAALIASVIAGALWDVFKWLAGWG